MLEILKRNGLTQTWLGEALGSGGNTARRWGSSMRSIPKCAAIVLRLIDSGHITPALVEDAGKDRARKRRS